MRLATCLLVAVLAEMSPRPMFKLATGSSQIPALRSAQMRKRAVTLFFGLLVVTGGCTGNPFDPTPTTPQTAEAFCATLPDIGFGNFFYCGTPQANLQGGLPNGWLGYCQSADTMNVGLVGYSATTFNGGAFPVTDFSTAQDECNAVNTGGANQCGSIIRCTRE